MVLNFTSLRVFKKLFAVYLQVLSFLNRLQLEVFLLVLNIYTFLSLCSFGFLLSMLLPSEVWKREVPFFILALAHLCFGVLMSDSLMWPSGACGAGEAKGRHRWPGKWDEGPFPLLISDQLLRVPSLSEQDLKCACLCETKAEGQIDGSTLKNISSRV